MRGKRWTAALLGAVALATLGLGCSGTSAPPTAAPTAKPAATSQPAAAPTQAAEPTVAPAPTIRPTEKPTAPPAQAAAAWQDEYSFDQVITVQNQPPQTAKLAYKKGRMRLEIQAMGQTVMFIAKPAEKAAYMWNVGQNQAIKLPYEQFEQQMPETPNPLDLGKDAATGKVVGTETIDGKPCDVYEVTSPAGTVKTWIWKEKGFPLRSEAKTPEGDVRVEFKNVTLGNLPDSLFELPAGMQVVDFGNMPGLPPVPTK